MQPVSHVRRTLLVVLGAPLVISGTLVTSAMDGTSGFPGDSTGTGNSLLAQNTAPSQSANAIQKAAIIPADRMTTWNPGLFVTRARTSLRRRCPRGPS